ANEGTRTATVVVNQSRQASAFAIVAADVGTASFQLRDITNSADIGTAVTHSYRRPMLVTLRNQDIPATCEAVRLSMLGLEASADIYWNMVSLYVHDSLTMRLPLFISEGFMAPRLFQGIPRTQIADNVYDAGSLDFVPLTEGVDYWPIFNQGDASQYRVRFRDSSLYNWPIFIEYQRPMSDLTTFAEDETATTNIAIHNVLPRWKMDVLNTILLGKIPKKRWDHLYEVAQSELISAKAARPIKSIGNPLPYYSPRNTGHLY
ncbi:MAG TPA: hypothetical protein VLA89_14195, partial [Gemmatimonadales bacterium]|nr:hypothetical protein [Gemmatimonadales bacterium]